ncbi:MAG: deoxyribodipyrimidine photo-lyase [Rickettsiales bacterium]|nr:deoxyribodipyrimidine photo-lyase [Rickettsiales bacterium]
MVNKPIIYWFRQDLRLQDNPAFYHASQAGVVIPIFLYDDINSKKHQLGNASKWWLHHSLFSLQKSLNNKLYIFSGNPQNILENLIKKYKSTSIYWNRCYESWQVSRDKNIKKYFKEKNIEIKTFNSSLLWEPWEVLTRDDEPYKVFTAFYKNAISNSLITPRKTLHKPSKLNIANLSENTDINILKLLEKNEYKNKLEKHWQVGEKVALTKFESFKKTGLHNYKEGRNYPSKENVSRLSPHLHWGEISPHFIWHNLNNHKDTNSKCFLSELGWREFSYHLLYHFPELPNKNLQNKFNLLPWKENKKYLEKWQKGQTGYPIIDAGMRELLQTGYMHNRVRMVVGSFLVKNLLLHWHHGEKWFWQHLVDADLANNSASWQWVAGCGADAAPFFRIFNPILQGNKFDPKGEYTRKYVPELKTLPDKYLFAPWEAPDDILDKSKIKLGIDYPYPIVDIKESREKALAAYEILKKEK